MTHKSVQNTLKKAQSRENGEWGAYSVYRDYAIGFDSYLHELNSSSRIMVFNLFAEERNLYPDTLMRWLDKPNQHYFNEAEGVYDMIYNVRTGKLSFHYEEEGDQFIWQRFIDELNDRRTIVMAVVSFLFSIAQSMMSPKSFQERLSAWLSFDFLCSFSIL